jgi:PKD repeat protein
VARTGTDFSVAREYVSGQFFHWFTGHAVLCEDGRFFVAGLDSVGLETHNGLLESFDAEADPIARLRSASPFAEIHDLARTGDGGLVLGTEGLVKLDSDWQREWSANLDDVFGQFVFSTHYCVAVDGEGAVYAAGGCHLGGDRRCFVAKFAADGSLVWGQVFGASVEMGADGTEHLAGGLPGYLQGIELLPGGGCVVAGTAFDGVHGGSDMLVVKIAPDGTSDWELMLGGEDTDRGIDLALAPDGGIVVLGSATVGGSSTSRPWLVKVRDDLHAPEPAFSIDPPPPVFHGRQVVFDSSATAAPGSSIVSRHWDFGDGSEVDDGPAVARHTYYTDGVYPVTLTVQNADGIFKSITREVEVIGLQIQWIREFGSSLSDKARGLIGAGDDSGGFVLVGTRSNRIWVHKTDARGLPVWTRFIGTEDNSGTQEGRAIAPASDGGYIVAATDNNYRTEVGRWRLDAWLLKLDENGDAAWPETRIFGQPGFSEEVRWVAPAADGGYILAGLKGTDPGNTEIHYPWLIKTAADGTQEWEQHYDLDHTGLANCVVQAPDGGFAFITETSAESYDVAKTDAAGTLLWSCSFNQYERGNWIGLRNPPEDGFATVGVIDKNIGLYLLDPLGVPDSHSSWTGSGAHRWTDTGRSAAPTPDGGFLVVGNATVPKENGHGGNQELALVKTDATGAREWMELYPGTEKTSEDGVAALALEDGSYVVLGNRNTQKLPIFLFKLSMNLPPEPRFTAPTDSLQPNEIFILDASDSSDPDGTVEEWIWHFDDGHVGHGEAGTYKFAEPGVHEIRLTVVDDDGAERSLVKTVTVQGIRAAGLGPQDVMGETGIEYDPKEHGGLYPLIGNVPLFSIQNARGFRYDIFSKSSVLRTFRITFPTPLPESFTIFRLPDWVEKPYAVVGPFTVEIREHVSIGDNSFSYLLVQLIPDPVVSVESLPDGTRLAFSFDCVEDYSYQVERTPDISDPHWQPVAHSTTPDGSIDLASFPGTGNRETIYVERPPELPAAFFRLRITLQPSE